MRGSPRLWLLILGVVLFFTGVGVTNSNFGAGMSLGLIGFTFVCMAIIWYVILKVSKAHPRETRQTELVRTSLTANAAEEPRLVQLREREVIREIVKIPCEHCRTLVEITSTRCPSCGAPLR